MPPEGRRRIKYQNTILKRLINLEERNVGTNKKGTTRGPTITNNLTINLTLGGRGTTPLYHR